MAELWDTYLPMPELQVLTAAAVAVAVVVFAALGWIVTKILERVTRPFLFPHELAVQLRSPLRLLVPLMAMQTVWTAAPAELGMLPPLRHITGLAIIGTFTWLGLRAVKAIKQVIIVSHPVDISDNLHARRIQTQTRVLVQTLSVLVLLIGVAGMLMTFPSARQFGTSLLASAGVAGLAVGFAAKPVLGNLLAGLQIAITQPIRLDDVVIVENEWGRIEEITGTYVVVRIWDSRRLIVPLQWFIENPFQNWTRTTASLLGSVFFWVDYATPLEPLREELKRLCGEVPHLWDGEVVVLQVTDCNQRAMQIRLLASSGDSSRNWDLRCYLRENLLSFLNRNYPGSLPKVRATLMPHVASADESTEPRQDTGEADRQPPV